MPRRSSGGRPAPHAATRQAPTRNPPQPARRSPPPTHAQGRSILGSIGAIIAEGMAFGTGNAMAHRIVDALLGPRTIHIAAPTPKRNNVGDSDSCMGHSKAFWDCLNNNGSDISKCQFYLNMLTEGQRNSGSTRL